MQLTPALLGNNCILIRALNALTQGRGHHEALRLVANKTGEEDIFGKGFGFYVLFFYGEMT